MARYASRVLVMYAGKIVDTGGAREMYGDPRHPYTLGLLNSVPRLDEPEGYKLETIEGMPPDLIDMGEGCRFAPRCRFAIDRCVHETPELMAVEGTHRAACLEGGGAAGAQDDRNARGGRLIQTQTGEDILLQVRHLRKYFR